MRVGIDYGQSHQDVEVREKDFVLVHRQRSAPPLGEPAAAVGEVLENPSGFPALRRALTPDDHVAILVDDHLPHLPELLVPILEHVAGAGVAPEAVTLLFPPATPQQEWMSGLPEGFRKLAVEVHDPGDRRHLSYLATTRQGRRLYLNRTAVDADQLVILARCRYDPLLGYSGAEGALYPALSDEATRRELCGRLSLAVPGKTPWPTRQEAAEVAWLLGAPFMVQIIEGAGDDIAHVLGGLADTAPEGQRLLNARWRAVVDRQADTVIAGVGGDPAHHDFADLARALACAARVVQPGGRIILLSGGSPKLGQGADLIRQVEEPGQALALLRDHTPPDVAAAFQWASSVQQATVYLFSGLPGETAEELFTIPMDHPRQIQRLLDQKGSCLFLADAQKTLAVPEGLPSAVADEGN